jgi:hypothetical protein
MALSFPAKMANFIVTLNFPAKVGYFAVDSIFPPKKWFILPWPLFSRHKIAIFTVP